MAGLRGLTSSFERLSTREKGLIVGMVTVLMGIIVFFVWLWVSSSLDALEEDIRNGKKSLAEIHALAEDYVGVAQKKVAIQTLIDENPIESLRIPVNTLADNITVGSDPTDGDGPGRGRKLTALIDYGGRTLETRLEPKSRTRRRGARQTEEDEGGNWEIEQSVEFRSVPIPTLYRFLEALERYDGLLFVRRLDLQRSFRDLEEVKATVHVSTIKFREGESR